MTDRARTVCDIIPSSTTKFSIIVLIVLGSSGSVLFTDVMSGTIWIRAVGRRPDGVKHLTKWLTFSVE